MLENNQLKLRALEPADVDKLFLWENDPENWRISHTLTPYSRHVLQAYINDVSDIYTDKQLRLMIEMKDTGKAIGSVDLFDCDFKNRRAGLGILIAGKANRGKGIATQVLEILIPYCFETLALHQVYCNVLSKNEESQALFSKFGFEEVGLKKDWTLHKGVYYHEILMQKIATNGEG
jgi:diamine N-acetyltransferase